MTINKKILLIASAFAALASSVSAAEINACDVWSIQIAGAVQSQSYNGDPASIPSVGPISATSCAGVYAGNNDQGGLQNPSPNLGYLNDGLLNGEGGLLSPTRFINPDQLQDLKGDGSPLDPGWIMLGRLVGNSGELSYSDVVINGKSFSLGNYVTYTQTFDYKVGGTWLLEVDKNIVSALAEIGLDRSVFDHLAFSLKASNYWAVYDFDFVEINAASQGAFDLNTPYVLRGTWTTNFDFYNQNGKGQDISHLAIWVRDPIPTNDVPAPGTIFLAGIGLVAAGIFRVKPARA